MPTMPSRAALGYGHATPKSGKKISKEAASHVKKHRKPVTAPTAATPLPAAMSPTPSPMSAADGMEQMPGLSSAQ